MSRCKQCGAVLSADEIGLHKKLVHRAAEEFLCIRCLADYFQCEEGLLRKKIEQFRAAGCQLFSQR